jgi:hypothetical protein
LRKLFDLFLTGKIELLHIVRLLFLLKEYCFLIKCLYHNVFDTVDMSFLDFLKYIGDICEYNGLGTSPTFLQNL